ncbi:MAG: DUF1302 family protein [Bacteroidota bacterium]
MKSGSVLVWLMLILTPAFSQSLFESSQSNNEKLVSSNLHLGGFIRSLAYMANTPETDQLYLQSAYGQAGLLLEANAGSWASAKTDIRFRYGTEFGEPVSEVDFREAYIDIWAGPASFRIGKLITPWGKGTVFNPTNKLTPLDPTVRSPVEDDMMLGSWAVQGRINLGSSMKLTATWKPLYQSSVLLIDPVPMPGYVNFLKPDYPGTELNEGSYGLNYDVFTSAADLSLYWFDGYHHWPGIAYDSYIPDTLTMEPLALNLLEKAYRIRMAGLDFSIPLGSWVFRAEGAWQQATESHDQAEYLPFPEISYTAELERSGTHLSILAGYYGKFILDYTPSAAEPSLSAGQEQFLQMIGAGIVPTGEAIDGMIRERIGAFNRLYNYQMEELYHTVFIVGKAFLLHDKIEITIPLIHHLTTGEWIVQPGVSFMPADGIKLTGGFSGLFGPEESLYDMVGPVLNAAYLSAQLSF